MLGNASVYRRMYNHSLAQARGTNSIIFRESTDDSKFTSYSINKGEEIVFCLRCKKTNQLHNINELMYVAIHEISHVACPEIGPMCCAKNFMFADLENCSSLSQNLGPSQNSFRCIAILLFSSQW